MQTVKEIIEHVINTDASAFRAALIQQANMHADMLDVSSNARACAMSLYFQGDDADYFRAEFEKLAQPIEREGN